jgi:hypothetical protein
MTENTCCHLRMTVFSTMNVAYRLPQLTRQLMWIESKTDISRIQFKDEAGFRWHLDNVFDKHDKYINYPLRDSYLDTYAHTRTHTRTHTSVFSTSENLVIQLSESVQ